MQTFRTTSPRNSRAFRALTAVAVAAAAMTSARCAPYAIVGSPASPANGTLGKAPVARSAARRPSSAVTAGGRATPEAIRDASAGTYIGQLLAERDSTLQRWPDRRANPIRVWLDGSLDGHQVPGAFASAVQSAFSEWASIGLPVRFSFVQRPQDAEVRVHWADHLPQKTGSTTWRADHSGWLTSGDITLATHISGGQPIDSRGMRQLALHEVGHLVGLSHSPNTSDIMAPLVRATDLSAEDIATARLLYSFQAGRVN
jgi:hypothetical protein